METNFLTEAEKFPNGEYAALTEELLTWQEKYSRYYKLSTQFSLIYFNMYMYYET
jgi:hypothetical protein